MDDCPEIILKKICCTCLSQNRKLKQLCRLAEGINNLYFLLSYDSEAYREGFYKDTVHWFICWECWALMRRISRFRSQACAAQRQLADIVDGRTDLKLFNTCFSRLSHVHKTTYNHTILSEPDSVPCDDNFIDCGPGIKSESEEDVPLSELNINYLPDNSHYSDDDTKTQEFDKTKTLDIKPVYKTRKKSNTKKKKTGKGAKNNKPKDCSVKDLFTMIKMSEEELQEIRQKRKMAATFADAKFKCESCIEGYKTEFDLEKHVSELHTELEHRTCCDVCLAYISTPLLEQHRLTHYYKHQCGLCSAMVYSEADVQRHSVTHHAEKLSVNKGIRKRAATLGAKSRRYAIHDPRTPLGYECTECHKYFDSTSQRWKHVQRHHREGYRCSTCDKRFAFKDNLARHERMHAGPLPRQECQHCHKQVRVDLLKVHMRTHSHRTPFVCAECDKRFASKASYEHHLKYTAKHAQRAGHKYKCSMCDKGYRSRGELRDHINYQHCGKTQHKCPICEKALATPRCVTRHVRRAHDGVKERARDKICQQCGKAFRDKKTLREHEFIHTGERPLSCELCGCTFRQSASLYTHRRRVHKLQAPKRSIQLIQA